MRMTFRRQMRLLKAYAITSVVAALVLGAVAIGQAQSNRAQFDEIDVKRINIVEDDGRVRLVLSNAARQHPGVVDGRQFPPRRRPAGLLFFNELGDEVGGLVFSGSSQDGIVRASSSLTLDQFRQDQTIALQYVDERGQRRAGLAVIDRPQTSLAALVNLMDKRAAAKSDEERAAIDKEIAALGPQSTPRMFVGRDVTGTAILSLSDRQGKRRLVMSVAQDGQSKIQFLDASGRVTKEIAP